MIRKSIDEDLDNIMQVYAYARQYMKSNGNYNQWKDNKPTREEIREDIVLNRHYIIEEKDEIIGCFTLIEGEDENYNYIKGKWINKQNYIALHKIASSGKRCGVLKDVLEFAYKINNNIKIDTHEQNIIMQHLLEKNGFKKCGIIYLEDKQERIAYQKYFKYYSILKTQISDIIVKSDTEYITNIEFFGQRFQSEILQDYNYETKVIKKAKQQIIDYFNGSKVFDLPLNPEGNDFRKCVWQLLKEIPYGKTITYKEIAFKVCKILNKEKMSAQAVGNAIGHNPISIVIPCHRVIGVNGKLVGYAGGLDKKKYLIELEKNNVN